MGFMRAKDFGKLIKGTLICSKEKRKKERKELNSDVRMGVNVLAKTNVSGGMVIVVGEIR